MRKSSNYIKIQLNPLSIVEIEMELIIVKSSKNDIPRRIKFNN